VTRPPASEAGGPFFIPSNEEILAADGDGVQILVVDSGVQLDHPAFEGREIPSWRVVSGSHGSRVEPDPGGGDVLGHGTAVAAILHEWAPKATIHSLRVFGNDLRTCSRMVLAGMQWAVAEGYPLLNCSFGSPDPTYLPYYKHAVDQAYCKNALLVAASNNVNFRKVEYPGSFPSVISTDFGPLEGMDLQRRPGQLVEFVTRGSQIRVAWKGGQYRTVTGSSFGAPHLTALVARLRQLRPEWTVHHIKVALYELARRGLKPASEAG
jgi:subtilisin family serine protease